MRPKLLLVLLPLLMAARASAVDPFYLSLLRDGQHAFDRKDYAEAARDLRLACFGMLDEPQPLTDCLARLALAQDRADNVEGFRQTFQRLVELEERFKAYSQGTVAPELRAALEQRLAARVPAATLATAPAFRPAAAAKPAAGSKPAAAIPSSPLTSPSARPPAPTAPPEPVKAVAAPADPEAITEAELKKLNQARRSLAEQRPANELKEAFQTAREVADAHPGFREAQHLAAEGAYRLSRWSDAATYFRRGGDPGEDEPERLFYMAVALFESGDSAGAVAVLKRALPNLKRTPYVDTYSRKILGQ